MRYTMHVLTVVLAVMITLPAATTAQHHHHHDHGVVNFPTSCSEEAQAHFERGLAMLHHMMYEQAEEHFVQASEADPSCSIAQWGIGMSQLHPLWAAPSAEAFVRGREAVNRARDLGGMSEREQAHVEALHAYFGANDISHGDRLRSWSNALQAVHDQHPGDVDAGALYGLSLLATARPDDRTFDNQRRAGQLLERLHEENPEHPGLFHYIIHAYDNPKLAKYGEDIARAYDQLAPDVPHALHMPSHIFVRLGHWEDVIDWNERSAEAALRQPVGDHTSMHHIHAIDYIVYAALQVGDDERAARALDEIRGITNYQRAIGSSYGLPAAFARYALERHAWEEAAQLDLREVTAYTWDEYPEFEAIAVFARGLGAARIGDLNRARNAHSTLERLYEQADAAGQSYWLTHVDVYRKTVDAWIAFADNRHDHALAAMREAADLEDSVDKHPVSPGAILPARELYGEMLMEAGRHDEAYRAFRTVLDEVPNRFNSLAGAARAANELGREPEARNYYRGVVELVGERAAQREVLAEAHDFLNNR